MVFPHPALFMTQSTFLNSLSSNGLIHSCLNSLKIDNITFSDKKTKCRLESYVPMELLMGFEEWQQHSGLYCGRGKQTVARLSIQ